MLIDLAMDKAGFVHGWNRVVGGMVMGFAILWTVLIALYALASIIDALGSLGWGFSQNVWLALGMTAFGLLFIWLVRLFSKLLTAVTQKRFGPDTTHRS